MRITKRRVFVLVAILCSAWAGLGWAQTLRVVGFNVESGGARPDIVDDLIAGAQDVDLWGLSEVQDTIWATRFAQAAAQGETGAFAPILGTTSGGDRLLIIYHQDRFDLIRQFELLVCPWGQPDTIRAVTDAAAPSPGHRAYHQKGDAPAGVA
jgi:hypothetical protein